MALTVLSWNVNGVRKRLNELEMLITKHEPDVITLQETMLGKVAFEFLNDKYTLHRRDRPSSFRGGVAVLIKNSLDFYTKETQNDSSVETATVVVKTRNGVVEVTSIYLPPGNKTRKSDLLDLKISRNPILIAGDLNAHNVNWAHDKTNLYGKWLEEKLITENLELHIPNKATRVSNRVNDSNNILDYAISHEGQQITIEVLDNEFTTSDHRPLLIKYFNICKMDNSRSNFTTNFNGMTKELDRPYFITEDTEYDVAHLTASIQAAIINNTKLSKKKKGHIYNSKVIRTLVNEKKQADKQYHVSRTPANKKILKNLKKKLDQNIKELKENEKIKRLSLLEDPILRWQILKHDKPKPPPVPSLTDSAGNTAETNQEKSDLLASVLEQKFTELDTNQDQGLKEDIETSIKKILELTADDSPVFTIQELEAELKTIKTQSAPGHDGITNKHLKILPDQARLHLLEIFNNIVKSGNYPLNWKHANVIMLHKSGKPRNSPNSYRPISLLPCMGKLLERLILHKINKKNIPDYQFGFRPGLSTTLQLTRLVNDIGFHTTAKLKCALVSLDIEAAFDKVPHNLLLHKLFKMDQPKWLVKLLMSYYHERTFQVKHQKSLSQVRNIAAGTAQGAVISPTLYSLFISDMPATDSVRVYQYADDTAYLATSLKLETAISRLNKQLEELSTWCTNNKTKINAGKSIAIIFKTPSKSIVKAPPIIYNNECIFPQDSVKYLGVTIDKNLNFQEHVDNIIQSANMKTGSLRQYLRKKYNISMKTKALLYNCMIRPVITYGLPSWENTSDAAWRKIESIETKWCRLVLGLSRDTHTEDLYEKLPFENLMKIRNKILLKLNHDRRKHPNPYIRDLEDLPGTPLARARPLIWNGFINSILEMKNVPEEERVFKHPDLPQKLLYKQRTT